METKINIGSDVKLCQMKSKYCEKTETVLACVFLANTS